MIGYSNFTTLHHSPPHLSESCVLINTFVISRVVADVFFFNTLPLLSSILVVDCVSTTHVTIAVSPYNFL